MQKKQSSDRLLFCASNKFVWISLLVMVAAAIVVIVIVATTIVVIVIVAAAIVVIVIAAMILFPISFVMSGQFMDFFVNGLVL